MKKQKVILTSILLVGIFITSIAQSYYTISGDLYYNNSNEDGMENSYVVLMNSGQVAIDTAETDANGGYVFEDLLAGIYHVNFLSTDIAFGGVTTTDATLIGQHYAQTITLDGIFLVAADVIYLGVVNSADALEVNNRANKTISSYTAVGDWVIPDNIQVVITSSNAERDIGTLCYGDVDGSYSW